MCVYIYIYIHTHTHTHITGVHKPWRPVRLSFGMVAPNIFAIFIPTPLPSPLI